MIKEAIDRILLLGKPEIITFGDRSFISKSNSITDLYDPEAKELTGFTLTALKEFIDVTNKNYLNGSFLQIVSHGQVSLVSDLFGANLQRQSFFTSRFQASSYPFGNYIPTEEFIVSLQAFFIQDEITESMLKVVGNIVHESKTETTDNGYTQSVTAKTGIARVGNVTIPNPVSIRPYRTFLEIDNQPAGNFIFRLKHSDKGPLCALFESGPGLWKLEAIKEIKQWLTTNIQGYPIIG